MRRGHPFISALILLIIGLQVNTFFVGSKYWPFMVYSMYRQSFSRGPVRGMKQRFFCITQGGKELEVDLKVTPIALFGLFRATQPSESSIIGLNSFALYKLYLVPMLKGDSSATQRLADRINVAREDPVVAFRLESDVYIISEAGVMTKKEQVFNYPVGIPR
jgi:hypothetical protein